MQTQLDSILSKKYLLATVIGVISLNLIANIVSKDTAILIGNLAYVPLAGVFLVLTILIATRFGLGGTHGLAWFSFAGFAVLAETLFAFFSSFADFFGSFFAKLTLC